MHLVINAAFPQNKRNAGVNEIEKQHLGENSPKVIPWKSSFLERERDQVSNIAGLFFSEIAFFSIDIDMGILDADY